VNFKIPDSLKLSVIVGMMVGLVVLGLVSAWLSSASHSAWAAADDAVRAAPASTPQPLPTTPPDASKITVTSPDADGYAFVEGAAGAVESLATVVVINLSAHTLMTTTAGADGSFFLPLYSPAGSSLLIKYETEGDRIGRFWRAARARIADATTENLNPLPGTIMHVGPPTSTASLSQDFSAVGSWQSLDPQGWVGWRLFGTLQVPPGSGQPGLAIQPGQTITISAHLHATSSALNCPGAPTHTANVAIDLRYLFNAEGRSQPWGSYFSSYLSTPTGLPIEHEGEGEALPLTSLSLTSFTCISDQTIEALLEVPLTIPADLPEGIYFPQLLLTGDIPFGSDVPLVEVWFHSGEYAALPPIRVGDPAPPRIPWSLLVDYPVNGHQGVQAREDQGQFAMPTRVLFPPHRVVFPRLDERPGEPLTYRLEPGSVWLSSTDRRLPNPPHIPLNLPSGHLFVEVHKPDGGIDQLGPAPLQQSSVRTPTTPGGVDLHEATGQIGDLYHLTTMDDAFGHSFEQYGPHVIHLLGEVEDIYGNVYNLESTYDLTVARVLDVDPAQLPTMPYMQGDAFGPGLHLFPPVPAQVHVRLVHMPFSDPTQAITTTITGQANRFGYFQPPLGTEIRLEAPGEFRVDITAEYEAADGTLWLGAMTWGGVVEGPGALIEAHGRRGMDYRSNTIDDMPAWFVTKDLPSDKVGFEVYYPYFSGDIHWGDETPDVPYPTGSIHPVITIKDLTGPSETFYNILRDHHPRAKGYRPPPVEQSLAGLNKRLAIDEGPLAITTKSGIDPSVKPEEIDLFSYFYGTSQRPDVRVREIISEDSLGTPYWRFNDTYGYQIGEPADGDQPGDIKWEFGGAVFRVISETNPINEYAIYSSFWVLLPQYDPVSTRVFPPFQDATGASINGGPIMTLTVEGQVQDIDMLFLPKGVRPGDVLEVGDVVAFSGHVGPPLDSRVGVTITSPSKVQHTAVFRANKIGWLYDPAFNFPADEPGRWTVDVSVLHDRPYPPNGVTPQSHNRGTVLGTSGQFEFYVVEPDSPALYISSPQPGFIVWPSNGIEPIPIEGRAPPGTTAVYYTIHDKGIVMGQGSVAPGPGGFFSLSYDAKALHDDFPMLSLTAHEGRWEGLADEVSIHLLAVGAETPRAGSVTLIGEEVFVQSEEDPGGIYPVHLPLVLKK